MAKLIAYVDKPESVSAAVQSGADELYVVPAMEGISGLTMEELSGAATFCRVRGVRLIALADLFPAPENFQTVVETIVEAWKNGADGVAASDPGLILALKKSMPDAPIYGGRLLNVHSTDCVRVASAMGLQRVAVAPEVRREDVAAILANAPMDVEIIAHGPMKPGFEGQNLLPVCSGLGSEKRGTADFSALSSFETGVKAAKPFIMPDICLFRHINELISRGAELLSVDCRGRSPEYAAVVAGIYSRAVNLANPMEDEFKLLSLVWPVSDYFDGWYTGKDTVSSPVKPLPAPTDDQRILATIRKGYLRREFQRVPVTFTAAVELGEPVTLTAEDDLGNIVSTVSGSAVPAFSTEQSAAAKTELYKTGGTPFTTAGVSMDFTPGLQIPLDSLADARDKLLNQLMKKREEAPARHGLATVPKERSQRLNEPPVLTVSVTDRTQLTDKLLELAPPVLYFPLHKLKTSRIALTPFIEKEGVSVCVTLPSVIFDSEKSEIIELLKFAKDLGISEASCGSVGHVLFLKELGFSVRLDLAACAMSGTDMIALNAFRPLSVTLSPELSCEEIDEMQKKCPAELIVYGRLPAVTSMVNFPRAITGVDGYETTAVIEDESGLPMSMVAGYNGRSIIYSGKKLYLAPRASDYMKLGLWGVRLSFTTESPGEVNAVAERYLALTDYDPPVYWRGLF